MYFPLTSHICLSRSSPWAVCRTVPPDTYPLGISRLGISRLGTCSPRSTSLSPCPCPWGRGGGHSSARLCVAEDRSRIYRSLPRQVGRQLFTEGRISNISPHLYRSSWAAACDRGICPALFPCPRSSDLSLGIDHDILRCGHLCDPHGDESLGVLPFRGGSKHRELVCGRGW